MVGVEFTKFFFVLTEGTGVNRVRGGGAGRYVTIRKWWQTKDLATLPGMSDL